MKARSALQIQKSVIFALVLREARARVGNRRFGVAWSLLEPIAHIVLLSLVFGVLRGREIAGIEYPVFVLVGLVPFLLYRNTALRLMDSPRENRSLFAYKQIRPLDTFLARALVEACFSIVVYAAIAAGFAWFGYSLWIAQPIQWVLAISLGLTFSFALGMLLALIGHAIPNVKTIIRMMFFPLYFISGVLMPAAYLPPAIQPYLLWNPFLQVLEMIRGAAISGYTPVAGISPMYVVAVTLVLLFASLGTYRARRLHLVSSKNG